MHTTTLIKRAAAKLEKKMLKEGCTAAQVEKALRINFPSLKAILAGKPTGRAIWVSKINLANSFSPTWQAKWPHAETRRVRRAAIQVLRSAQAYGL